MIMFRTNMTEKMEKQKMKPGNWLICFFVILSSFLIITGVITVYFDPFFHYHAPLKAYFYKLDNERYQNDGIMKHFNYDSIITGTSMAENFKTTDFKKLFGGEAIKVPYSGGSFCEISKGIEDALKTHKVKIVIRSLDYGFLSDDKDYIDPKYDADYLSDKNIFNDIKYLVNKDVLIKYCYPMVVLRKEGVKGGYTSFDEYANWMDEFREGENPEWKGHVIKGEEKGLSEKQRLSLKGNIDQNFLEQAKRYPDTEFYLFFPPYSIAYWQLQYEEGRISERLESEEETIRLLIDCENIKLFSFNEETDMITDLSNYSDALHYVDKINTQILTWMKDDIHWINKKNYDRYINWEKDFFLNYEYENQD